MTSIAEAKRADNRVKKELHLSPAQLRYLLGAKNGAVQDWAAPSHATLNSLLKRGLLESRYGYNTSRDAAQFFYITAAGYQALDIASRAAMAAPAKQGGEA